MKKFIPFFALLIFSTVQLTKAQVVLDTIGAGSALGFNGNVGNHVYLGPVYKTFNFPFSFEVWVNPASVPGLNAGVFSLDNSTVYYGWWLVQNSTGQVDVSFGNSQGFGYQYRRGFNTVNALPLNTWTHIAVVCTSVTHVAIYFNGVLQNLEVDDGISSDTIMEHSTTGVASIGEIWTSTLYDPFNGQIDEVRLWSDSISQTAIRQNMCRKIDPNTPGLLGYWRADEADTSNTVYDYTTNGINGALVGTVNREISDAPLGNTSTYLYIANWNTIALKLGSATGDTLTADQISGLPDGVHIYAVNSKPYYTAGLQTTPASYFGVFCVNGSSPAYRVTCNYSLNDGAINASDQDSARLLKRIDATDTPWTALNGILNTTNQTISKTSQPSPQEYILDVFCDVTAGIIPQSPTICSGTSITLNATTPGLTYLWSPAQSLSNSTGDTVVATPTVQTTYTLVVTSAAGCSATDSDVVYISPAPDQPTIAQNDSILTTNATQGIQWSRNDTVLEGATTQNYTITVAGWYKVVVVNPANGCSATSDSMYFAPTGIFQVSINNSQLSIYPNPGDGKINIASSKTIDELKVFNVLGQLIYEAQPKQTQFTFELKDEGIYFIAVTVGNETATGKVAVSK